MNLPPPAGRRPGVVSGCTKPGGTFFADRGGPFGLTAALLLLCLGWLILSAPWLVGGQVVPWDSKDQFYPTLYFVGESIQNGESPFWNPYVFGGYPSVSDPQSMMFSPLALSLMLLVDHPSIQWFDTIELFHLLLAGVGVLLLLVRLGCSPTAGLYGAFVYMFGGSAAGRMQHVPMIYAYACFPFALLALDAMLESRRLRWALGFGVVAGVMAAHLNQVAYLFCLVLLGYAFDRAIASRSVIAFLFSRWRVFVAAAAAGIGTLALPLYAVIQFLPFTNRASVPLEVAGQNTLHPLAWMTFFASDFIGSSQQSTYWGPGDLSTTYLYVGALPMVLFVRYGLARGAVFEGRLRYFAVVGGLCLLYSLGDLTPFYSLAYHVIPGVSFYRRPTDASFVINLVLAVATGCLMQRQLTRTREPTRPILAAATSIILIGFVFWALVEAWRGPGLEAVRDVFPGAVLLLMVSWALLEGVRAARSRPLQVAVLCSGLVLLVADLGLHNVGRYFNAHEAESLFERGEADELPTALRQALNPDVSSAGYRAEFVSAGSQWFNAPMVFGIQSSQGYNPLRYSLYERAAGTQAMDGSARPFPPMLSGYDAPMLDLLGVRYLVSGRPLSEVSPDLRETSLPGIDQRGLHVWENPDPVPRVIAATSVYIDSDPDGAIDEGRMAPVDHSRTVVLDRWPDTLGELPHEQDSMVELPGTGSTGVAVLAYRNTEVVVETDSARDVILVLHDLYYPYWGVTVDGEQRDLLRADYIFRGVHVPPGRHQVVFRFHPFALTSVMPTLSRFMSSGAAGTTNHRPQVASVSPAIGSGPTEVFTFRFRDPDGYQDIAFETLLFNDSLSAANGCYLYHQGASIQLADDAGTDWMGPVSLGTPSVLENSRCRVNALTSSVAVRGVELAVSLDLTFLEGFDGIQLVWGYAEDGSTDSGARRIGRWAVWDETPTLMDRIRLVLSIPGE